MAAAALQICGAMARFEAILAQRRQKAAMTHKRVSRALTRRINTKVTAVIKERLS
jgi:hypothetical protein